MASLYGFSRLPATHRTGNYGRGGKNGWEMKARTPPSTVLSETVMFTSSNYRLDLFSLIHLLFNVLIVFILLTLNFILLFFILLFCLLYILYNDLTGTRDDGH